MIGYEIGNPKKAKDDQYQKDNDAFFAPVNNGKAADDDQNGENSNQGYAKYTRAGI